MNRVLVVVAACGVLLVTAFASSAVSAQEALSEAHVERIRQNCVAAQTTLGQLHASDGLLRVNRGPLYENISTKLMAPLNSRIAYDRLGGLELAATSLEYDRQLDVFRASYKQYEESMTRMLRVNCTNQPREFYEGVRTTRELREKLHADTAALTELLKRYKAEFEVFAQEFEDRTK